MQAVDMGMSKARLKFLGIQRESEFSPGKVEADAAILYAVAARLAERGYAANCVAADGVWPFEADERTVVFAMCQGASALQRLDEIEARGGRVINRPAGIRASQRYHALPLLQRAGLPIPRTVLVPTSDAEVLSDLGSDRLWVKRGDVHATEAGDVVFVDGRAELAAALSSLHRRGIERAAVQQHAPGDVVKFYATAGGFFHCVTTTRSFEPAIEDELRDLARRAAAAVGLEVYGGDVVVGPNGVLSLIDLNDWPSYGPCRAGAAAAIAAYLMARGEQPCD